MPETQTMPALQAQTQCQGYRQTHYQDYRHRRIARTTDTDQIPGLQTQT